MQNVMSTYAQREQVHRVHQMLLGVHDHKWVKNNCPIYPKPARTLIQRDTCTPMFIAALFATAKI